jgi:hypothetical protein
MLAALAGLLRLLSRLLLRIAALLLTWLALATLVLLIGLLVRLILVLLSHLNSLLYPAPSLLKLKSRFCSSGGVNETSDARVLSTVEDVVTATDSIFRKSQAIASDFAHTQ